MFLNRLTPAKRLTIGLVSLTITLIMLAQLIGIIPNEEKSALENRKIIAESLALQITNLAARDQLRDINSILQSIVTRNPDMLSAGVRSNRGLLRLETGEHRKNWIKRDGNLSTTEQIQVPVYHGRRHWGTIELRFTPLASTTILGIHVNKGMLLLFFIALVGSIFFGLYLRKALKYLDPSAVIPDRVKNAMDIISEGILILDENDRIILANQSLSEKLGLSAETLIGKTPQELSWHKSNDDINIPWIKARQTGKSVAEVPIKLTSKKFGARSFLVNAAPISADDDKVRGCMVTFNDVTQLQQRNVQLKSAVNTLKRSQDEVRKKNRELTFLASRDPLTGCLNRRAFFQVVEARFIKHQADNEKMSIIMLDIDHFKSVNDNYGHSVGDVVIKMLAKTVMSSLREGDLACRYGGEEFCIYLKETSARDAEAISERIRQNVEALDFSDNPATVDMKITSSFGIADLMDEPTTLEQFIELADQALYFSKENGRNKVTLWHDIKDISESEAQDSNAEHTSPDEQSLTGRPRFISELNTAIESGSRDNHGFATLLLDIDMFKRINNTLGHNVGDKLLDQIQQRIFSALESLDVTAISNTTVDKKSLVNMNGDEFAIILHGTDQHGQVKQISAIIQKAVSEVYKLGDLTVNLTCSIGSSIWPQDGDNAEMIMRNIEIAATRAKDRGGNLYQPYFEELNTNSIDELKIENKLHNALQNDELYLEYQPKIDLKTGQIMGVEALARWKNPELGLVSPGRFIPIAEQAGLISELGLWVLKTACIQGKKWLDAGLTDIRVAVNLSALQLKKNDFLDRVMNIFNETGFNPHNLELEVTENMVMENIETVTPILYQLHEQGVAISIDDFGIGYSSLNYIKRFPISVIKIDRSFIVNISEDKDDLAIVSAIIAMAQALNLKVVAEGAEHANQVEILRKLGCDQLQGFVFCKPVPYEQISKLLYMNAKQKPAQPTSSEQYKAS